MRTPIKCRLTAAHLTLRQQVRLAGSQAGRDALGCPAAASRQERACVDKGGPSPHKCRPAGKPAQVSRLRSCMFMDLTSSLQAVNGHVSHDDVLRWAEEIG